MRRVVRCDQRVFESLSYKPELFQFIGRQFRHAHTVLDWLDDQPSEESLLLVRVMVHHPMRSKRYHSTIDIVRSSGSPTTLAILLSGHRSAPFLAGQARHATYRSEFKV